MNADITRTLASVDLRTEDLQLSYGSQLVIDHLDLTLPAGRLTAIVGPNACGKSTLLKAVARVLRPVGGAVFLDDVALQSMPTRQIARRLGMLPQNSSVPEGITVGELVERGRTPHQSLVRQWSSSDEDAVRFALDITGTSDLVARRMDELSGGQRQRVWIALVVAQETAALLLDEPTTYLDVAHQLEVMQLIRKLSDDYGRTIVTVLHDLNLACRFADHLIAVRDGRVVVEGPPSEVVTVDLMRSVFDVESSILLDPRTGSPMVVPHAVIRC